MKAVKIIGSILAAAYLLVCVALYVFQEVLIFHPRPRAQEYSYGNYPETYIEVEPGIRLNAITIPAGQGREADGVILYLHGNKGDNGRSRHQTKSFAGGNYDTFLVDYRGYGKSGGQIGGEENMTDDLQIVYDQLKTEYAEDHIIIVGYSLGTGPATYLAARNNPQAVVLVAPYTSLIDMKNQFFWMFPDFLMNYELNNLANLAKVEAPVTILHGTADRLIPVSMGKVLAAANPDKTTLVKLEGVSHRGAIFTPELPKTIANLTRQPTAVAVE